VWRCRPVDPVSVDAVDREGLTRDPHSQPLRAGALAAATVAVGLTVTQSGPAAAQSKQFAIRGIGTGLDEQDHGGEMDTVVLHRHGVLLVGGSR